MSNSRPLFLYFLQTKLPMTGFDVVPEATALPTEPQPLPNEQTGQPMQTDRKEQTYRKKEKGERC